MVQAGNSSVCEQVISSLFVGGADCIDLRESTNEGDCAVVHGSVAGEGLQILVLGGLDGGSALTAAGAQRAELAVCEAVARGERLLLLIDSPGLAPSPDAGLASFAPLLTALQRATRQVSLLVAVVGDCPGSLALLPGAADLVLMQAQAHWFVSAPSAVRAVTGEACDEDDLGGAAIHAERSGACQLVAAEPGELGALLRWLAIALPARRQVPPPRRAGTDSPTRPLWSLAEQLGTRRDVREVLSQLVDDAQWLELGERHAPNLLTALGHLGGHAVGLIASQPTVLAAAVDVDALGKAARFVRQCARWSMPVVRLLDVPGFLPSRADEQRGVAARAAELLAASAEASLPSLSVVLRQAQGAAYCALRGDVELALEGSRVGLGEGDDDTAIPRIPPHALRARLVELLEAPETP